ncbi:MAG: hypothetical protein JKX73_06355 [Flavobacteriales bacterium]|nr:hypothetical protein [Flavobacteriales bacterium]
MSCKNTVTEIDCSGTVTDYYTQAPLTSGFVRFAPLQYKYTEQNSDYSGRLFENEGRKHGAVINPDGTYDFSIEEKGYYFEDNFEAAVFTGEYISSIYTVSQGVETTIDFECKPLRILCLRVGVVSDPENRWILSVSTDKILEHNDTLKPSETSPFLVESDTLYYQVVPDANCSITVYTYSSSFDSSFYIMNVDTTIVDISI